MLLKPRWLVAHVIVVVAVVAFVNLGFWQVRRLQGRLARNAVIEARMNLAPEPLDRLLADLDPDAPVGAATSVDYRRTVASGRFDPDHEVLLRFRSRDGEAGYEVLTPLVLDDGSALLVDRGWVPYDLDTPPVASAAPPDGIVRVDGLMRAPQREPRADRVALVPRDPPEGALQRPYYADPRRLAAQMPYPLVDATLTLLEQQPPQAGTLPVPETEPVLDNGPHLSYAIQWFSFTIIVLVGYAYLLRHTVRGSAKRRSDGEAATPEAS